MIGISGDQAVSEEAEFPNPETLNCYNTLMTLTEQLKAKAQELGFSFVGVVSAEPSPYLAAYMRWISAEMHGKMGYLARPDRLIRREDLTIILPNVRSLVCVGLDYFSQQLPSAIANDPSRGRISNYAWGVDYHDVMTPRLKQLAAWLRDVSGNSVQSKVYVDTGAILERSHAESAGLGFAGKNTMLIHPHRGSYFFLGELLTTLPLDPDTPRQMPGCGSCTRCLTACPTDAFPTPYTLDARRCISYLTIELKDAIPVELRPLIGNWIYGCDICQDVCPWNRFAPQTQEETFRIANLDTAAPKLQELLALDEPAFKQRFANSPILRIKWPRFMRNVCVAAGNWGSPAAVPALKKRLHTASPLVRDHATWALSQIKECA